jgi:hypothetical protein
MTVTKSPLMFGPRINAESRGFMIIQEGVVFITNNRIVLIRDKSAFICRQ